MLMHRSLLANYYCAVPYGANRKLVGIEATNARSRLFNNGKHLLLHFTHVTPERRQLQLVQIGGLASSGK